MVRPTATPQILALLGLLTLMVGCNAGVQAESRSAEVVPAPEGVAAERLPGEGGESRSVVFAAGCFWCVEGVFERVVGVTDVVSGYAGGTEADAEYRKVAMGQTDHAEAVQVTYNPQEVTYGQLLRVFFQTHDPTQLNRQGPDYGEQYRTAIFYSSEAEQMAARAYIDQLTEANAFDSQIETTLEPLDEFYEAETYHQDYVHKNPDDAYVQQWYPGKLEKLNKLPASLLKDQAGDE